MRSADAQTNTEMYMQQYGGMAGTKKGCTLKHVSALQKVKLMEGSGFQVHC